MKKMEQGKRQMLLTGKEDGFTLLEVIITLVIIGIVLGINLPVFHQMMASIEERSGIRKIDNFFKKVRIRAVLEKKETLVKVDSGGFSYKPLRGDNYLIEIAVENLLQEKEGTIIFYPDGSSTGGSFKITFQSGQQYYLSINSVTGETEWGEYYE